MINTLNFEFSIDETNIIFESLKKEPFGVVADLVTKIQIESQKQIEAAKKAELADAKEEAAEIIEEQ